MLRAPKGKNGGHVLPLRKLRDLRKDPLRVPQVFPINVKGNTLPIFSETFWCTRDMMPRVPIFLRIITPAKSP